MKSLVKHLQYVVLSIAFAAGCGCSGTQTAPSRTSATMQSVMQSTVELAANAFNVAVAECLAEASLDAGTSGHQCYVALQPVHDAIISAGIATQVYSDADAQNLPCLLQDIANGLANAAMFMKSPPQALHDAAVIANQFSTSCKRGDQ